jgi:hypothetical protein
MISGLGMLLMVYGLVVLDPVAVVAALVLQQA